jgi:hypothetical protein
MAQEGNRMRLGPWKEIGLEPWLDMERVSAAMMANLLARIGVEQGPSAKEANQLASSPVD